MQIFCVPSHHDISPTPLNAQGVLLTSAMLEPGIWNHGATDGVVTNDNEYKCEMKLVRSENQPEYTAALSALLDTWNDEEFLKATFAVVSMRWCSMTYRLVTVKRVWLAIYTKDGHQMLKFSHKEAGFGSPTYNFCDCWENPEPKQEVWKERLTNALLKELQPAVWSSRGIMPG